MSQEAQSADDELEQKVGPLLEKLSGKDMEWARSVYDEKMEEVEEKLTRDIDEEQKRKYAIGLTRSEISNLVNLGDTSQIQFITLGFNSPLPFDDPVFRGHGIAIPDDQPAGLAQVRMNQSDASDVGLTFSDLEQLFRPWKTLDIGASIREANKMNNAYVLQLQQGSEVEESDDGMDKEDMIDLADTHVDSVTLQEVGKNLSLQNENGFPEEFGLDIKKIPEAYVVGLQIGGSSARYILQDETVVDPEELDPSIRGDDAGLTAWMQKEIVEYGTGSILDVYGVTKTTDDGEVNMNIVGVDPILPQEIEQDFDSSSSSGSSENRSENVSEREI